MTRCTCHSHKGNKSPAPAAESRLRALVGELFRLQADDVVARLGRIMRGDPLEKGGSGSGNFGHAGRPGEVGGSDDDNRQEAYRDLSKGEREVADMLHAEGDMGYWKASDTAREISEMVGNPSKAKEATMLLMEAGIPVDKVSDALDECIAFFHGSYDEINKRRRTRGTGSEFLEQLVTNPPKGYQNKEAILYRGLSFYGDERKGHLFVEGLRQGSVLSDAGFISATSSLSVAKGFAENADVPVLFEISGCKGKGWDVPEKLFKDSMIGGEKEVVLPPGSKFRVMRIDKIAMYGKESERWMDYKYRVSLELVSGKKANRQKGMEEEKQQSKGLFLDRMTDSVGFRFVKEGEAEDVIPSEKASVHPPLLSPKWDARVVRATMPLLLGVFTEGGNEALRQIRKFPRAAKGMRWIPPSMLEKAAPFMMKASRFLSFDEFMDSYAAEQPLSVAMWIDDPEVLKAAEREAYQFAQAINSTTADALREVIAMGMDNGDNIRTIANSISNLSEEWAEGWRAEMIARTETARAYTVGRIEAWRATGVVKRVVWSAAGDACPFCQQLDGTVVDLGEPFARVGETLSAEWNGQDIFMDITYADVLGAPLHPNCRCAVVGEVDYEALRGGGETLEQILAGDVSKGAKNDAGEDGRWVTMRGRRVFIREGQDPKEALEESLFTSSVDPDLRKAFDIANKAYSELTPNEITHGHCDKWATIVNYHFPDCKIKHVDLWPLRGEKDLPYHVWVEYKGKAFDAETLGGVKSFKDLPYFKTHKNQAVLSRLHPKDFPDINIDDERAINVMKSFKGGPGSGHFGHAGRPGEVGGSADVPARFHPGPDPKKPGKGGKWTLANGKPLPAHVPRNIPPGYTDVLVSLDPASDILYTARDSKGRTQTKYSESFMDRQKAAKFSRVRELLAKKQAILKENEKDVVAGSEEALVTKLIFATGLRPGSAKDTKAEKLAYGATTLLAEHVAKAEGGGVLLHFTGKKGVDLSIPVEDRSIAKVLLERKARGGKLFGTSERLVLSHVGKLDGGGFLTKDIRTAVGTETALAEVRKMAAPASEKEYKRAVHDVAKVVSAKLGNTPAVALQSYIAPEVFSPWRKVWDGERAVAAKSYQVFDLDAEIQFGEVEELPDWRKVKIVDDEDPDDELLETTPEDVVETLGFDPLELLEGEQTTAAKGGPGSGHFGHSGRPGEVGGSDGDSGDHSEWKVHLDSGPEGWEAGRFDVTRIAEGLVDPREAAKIPGKTGEELLFKKSPYGRYEKEGWESLVASIKKEGLNHPPMIVKQKDGSTVIWEGNHRVRAAIAAGLTKIPVEIQYWGNSQRSGLIPIDKGPEELE